MKLENVEDLYRLSHIQQGLLFHTLYSPNSGEYFQQRICTIHGEFDDGAFERAWQEIARRHPVFRTAFFWEGLDEPIQVVRQRIRLPYERHDWQDLSPAEQERRLEEFIKIDREHGFELSVAPLIRMATIRRAPDIHQFILSYHHILLDGWSTLLVLKDVVALYKSFLTGEVLQLENNPPYREYISWLQRQDMSKAELFWGTMLKGFTKPTAVVEQNREAGNDEHEYGKQEVIVSAGTTAGLKSSLREYRVTLNTLVQGLWALLLSRYTGEDDILFATTVSGRPTDLIGAESIVGLFVNTLPVRVQINPAESFLSWLKKLQDQQVEMRQFEYAPLIEIQRWSELPRGIPLSQTLLIFENYLEGKILDQLYEVLDIQNVQHIQRTNYDLTLLAIPSEELSLQMLYSRHCFNEQTIAEMLQHLILLLETAGKWLNEPLEALAKIIPARKLKISVASSFTAQPLEDSLSFWLEQFRIPHNVLFAPYNQVFQQLLDTSSLLSTNQEGINIIVLRVEDWLQENLDSVEVFQKRLEQNVQDFISAMETFSNYCSSALIVCLCPPSDELIMNQQKVDCVHGMETLIAQSAESLSGIHLIGYDEVRNAYCVLEANDPISDRIGHIPYTTEFFAALGSSIVRKMISIFNLDYKVVALDCDDTIWGGVCGEDGVMGIQLGAHHRKFQEFLLGQFKAGRLLCLCSKNNESDVFKVFRYHADMPLKLNHITSWRICWELASKNILALSRELHLPSSSFIYISGNPAEIAEIRTNCPEVLALQLPLGPDTTSDFLDHVWAFDRSVRPEPY